MENIQEILADLYQLDPGLKQREVELTQMIDEMTKNRPQAEINEVFLKELRGRILDKTKELKASQIIVKQPIAFNWLPRAAYILAGAAVCYLLILNAPKIWRQVQPGVSQPLGAGQPTGLAQADSVKAGDQLLDRLLGFFKVKKPATNVETAALGIAAPQTAEYGIGGGPAVTDSGDEILTASLPPDSETLKQEKAAATTVSAPEIIAPADNSTVFAYDFSQISWTPVEGALKYELDIQLENLSDRYPSSYIDAGPGTSYKWWVYIDMPWKIRVRAVLNGSRYSPWSAYHFATAIPHLNYANARPVISKPKNNQIFTAESVEFAWNDIAGKTGYHLEIQYMSGNKWLEEAMDYYPTADGAPRFWKNFGFNNKYRCRARAVFTDRTVSEWSDWRNFEVKL